MSLYDGEIDIYLALLRSHTNNTPASLEKLKDVTEETLPDYTIGVHGLKGTSASIGVETVREAAKDLEAMGRAGDLQGVLAKNEQLLRDTEIVVANIKTWLENYDTKNEKPRLKALDRELLARLRQYCENFNIMGIDETMDELETADYEEVADLVAWLREKIDISEIGEVAERLAKYEGKPAT